MKRITYEVDHLAVDAPAGTPRGKLKVRGEPIGEHLALRALPASKAFVIDHLPTGYSVARVEAPRSRVRELAQALAAFSDWGADRETLRKYGPTVRAMCVSFRLRQVEDLWITWGAWKPTKSKGNRR